MEHEPLDDDNFESYAMRHYDNPHCTGMDEFEEDLDRIKYVKLLLRKYDRKGVLRERLILNHMIVLRNVFGPVPAARMLFYRSEKELHSYLKTFLRFLGGLPQGIPEANVEGINADNRIQAALEQI